MQNYEKWILNLNKTQKIIISIAVPIVLFIMTLPIAHELSRTFIYVPSYGEFSFSSNSYTVYNYFDFSKNWWAWTLYVVLVFIVEFKLFKNK